MKIPKNPTHFSAKPPNDHSFLIYALASTLIQFILKRNPKGPCTIPNNPTQPYPMTISNPRNQSPRCSLRSVKNSWIEGIWRARKWSSLGFTLLSNKISPKWRKRLSMLWCRKNTKGTCGKKANRSNGFIPLMCWRRTRCWQLAIRQAKFYAK